MKIDLVMHIKSNNIIVKHETNLVEVERISFFIKIDLVKEIDS